MLDFEGSTLPGVARFIRSFWRFNGNLFYPSCKQIAHPFEVDEKMKPVMKPSLLTDKPYSHAADAERLRSNISAMAKSCG